MLLKSPVCAQESPPCDLSVCTHLCLQIREAGSLILYIHRNCASAAVLLLFGAAVYGSEVHGLHILFVPLPCQKGKTSVPLPVTVAKTFHPVRCWEFVPQLHRGPRIIWGTSAACAAALADPNWHLHWREQYIIWHLYIEWLCEEIVVAAEFYVIGIISLSTGGGFGLIQAVLCM